MSVERLHLSIQQRIECFNPNLPFSREERTALARRYAESLILQWLPSVPQRENAIIRQMPGISEREVIHILLGDVSVSPGVADFCRGVLAGRPDWPHFALSRFVSELLALQCEKSPNLSSTVVLLFELGEDYAALWLPFSSREKFKTKRDLREIFAEQLRSHARRIRRAMPGILRKIDSLGIGTIDAPFPQKKMHLISAPGGQGKWDLESIDCRDLFF